MRAHHEDRSRDEELLLWLAMRTRGYTTRKIAFLSGANPGAIVMATNRIRAADIAESGERDAEKGYWT